LFLRITEKSIVASKQDILPFFWSACAKKIDSKEQRKEVAEHAILLRRRGLGCALRRRTLAAHNLGPGQRPKLNHLSWPCLQGQKKNAASGGASFPAAAAG
jgi:hypothetical protein